MDETQADQSIRRFAIKTAIVAVAVTASGWILGAGLDSLIDARVDQIHRATRINGRAFWGQMEENIMKAADPSNDLPPEKKAKLLAAVRTLADRWRPFLAEITADPGRQPATDQK
jgi:hypothetical protein